MSSLNGRAIKSGRGVQGRAIKEKNLFQRSNIPMAIKLEGGKGGYALMAGPLREELSFLRLPLGKTRIYL